MNLTEWIAEQRQNVRVKDQTLLRTVHMNIYISYIESVGKKNVNLLSCRKVRDVYMN